jgi:hypothetical protein
MGNSFLMRRVQNIGEIGGGQAWGDVGLMGGLGRLERLSLLGENVPDTLEWRLGSIRMIEPSRRPHCYPALSKQIEMARPRRQSVPFRH